MSPILHSKIAAVQQKHVMVSFATGLVAAVGALTLGLGVGMLLDWWLDLPMVVRAVFLAVDLSVLVFIILAFIVSPIVFGPDEEAVALRVEESEPTLASRLIASVQLSRPGAVPVDASSSLVRAMIAQTEAMARNLDFGRIVKTDRLTKYSLAAGLILLLGLGGFAWGFRTDVSTDLLKRALLERVDVPRKTRIIMGQNADMTVARGDTVTIAARAAGIIPDHGDVDVRFDNGREQTFTLDADKSDVASFGRDLENVQDSFTYRIRLNDGKSAWHTVTVLTRPIATSIDVEQRFPAYTHLGTLPRSLGDLSILAGSHLNLHVTSNNPCNATPANQGRPSVVHLTGTERDVPMQVDPQDPRRLNADVEVPENATGFAVRLVDENGMNSAKDAAVYRIDVIQDKDPVVRVTYPMNREELATKVAHVVIGFDAVDDFGIAKVSLKYKIDDGDVQAIPLDVKGEPASLRNRYDWSLAKIGALPAGKPSLEGTSIEYWIEAVDNNNVRKSGPGVGSSEHYALRIVSEEVKRAEVAARMAGQIETLKSGIDDEQDLSDRLGTFVTEKKPRP